MEAKVDQHCPSCGTDIHCEASIESLTGSGLLKEVTTHWDCPSCGTAFEHTTPFDVDLFDTSGFHSWVGSLEDELLCVVIDGTGAEYDDSESEHVRKDTGHTSGRTGRAERKSGAD